MKDSIQSVIAPRAFDCRPHLTAHQSTWREGKCRSGRDRSFGNPLAKRMTLLCLEMEKRRLFPERARELP
jgi:hypothetical protein